MDDTRLESDAHLITPQKENRELSVLQAIIDDGSCDVSTQTLSRSVTQLTADDRQYQEVNLKGILYRPSSKSKKSSFRLFIVPDDSGNSDTFHDSNLRLSLDQEQLGINSQSLRFSITSNECDVENESTEPLRNSKDIKTDQRRRNTFKRSERIRKDTVSSVGLEKGNSDATIDHQLMRSTNPSVLAWLKVKNFEEREKRRRKKQEKKELRRHAYEEAEKRQKRIEESEKQFTQWLIAKKKEARCVWKAARTRKRLAAVENESTVRKDNDPPPNYTAVPTFNGAQALVGGDVSVHIGSISINTNRKSTADNELETGNTYKHENDITTESSQLIQTTAQEQSANGIILERNHESDQVRLHKDNNHNKRPVTADSRLLSVNGINSKFSSRKTEEEWPDKKSKHKRPNTSGGCLTRNANTMGNKEIKAEVTYETWMVQKRKEQKSKRTSTQASDPNLKDSKKPIKKSITFEAWKAQKQQEIKENAKLKKRQIVDDALTDAILKMGRKRVENLCKEKRRLDTGMPKWQARNRVESRPSTGEQNASNSNASHSRCTVIQFLGNEHDNHNTPKTGTLAKEVSAIRKSC
mgnify:CR=1 FL=1